MSFSLHRGGHLVGRAGRSWWVRAVLLLVGLAFCVNFDERATADRLPPDPVEELRQALKQEHDTGRDTEPGRGRRIDLAKKAEAIKSLADLSRALLLDTRDTGAVALDLDIQVTLVRRFQEAARKVMAQGTPLEKAATAYLIGETASATRTLSGSVGQRSQFLRHGIAALGPDLIRLAHDASPRVREAAATALGKIEPELTADDQVGAVGGITAAYAASLRAAGSRQVVAALAALLDDDSFTVRREAARSLNGLVYVASQQEKKSRGLPRDYQGVRNELLNTSALVIPAAAKALKAAQPLEVRRAAADACRQITAALIDLVPDPLEPGSLSVGLTPQDRRQLNLDRRLSDGEGEEFRPVLQAFLANIKGLVEGSNDPNTNIRIVVRHVIEELAAVRQRLLRQAGTVPPPEVKGAAFDDGAGPAPPAPPQVLQEALKRTVSALVAGLKDPDGPARLAAIDALETMEGAAKSALPALVRRTRDPDRFVRWAATRTLGRLAPARPELVVPAVQVLLRDDDLDLRLVAAGTLNRYGPAAAPAVDDLARSVRKGDPEIRIAAMRALESIGTAAEPALPAMVEDLTYHNPQVRATAARTLARFGPAAAFAKPALSKAVRDPDAEVRRAASEALLKIEQK